MDIITNIVQKLKGALGIGQATTGSSDDTGTGTPVEIDWSKWSPAGSGDVRSPCPAINALANHGILPHNGKGITKAMAVEALSRAYNLDTGTGSVFAAGAVASNPDHSTHTFDLNHVNKHGFIEHDVSLSRDDIAFGDNHTFSKEKFDGFLQALHSYTAGNSSATEAMTTWTSAAEARYARVLESKAKHEAAGKSWTYGVKEAVASYGETALYLNVLGKAGVAPVQWVKIFFEEERLPYAEGWRPHEKIDQGVLNSSFREMLKSYSHGKDEASIVGVGTFDALRTIISSLGIGLSKFPALK